jgi:NADPH:quinone reductase-like Zn-dependent oxidoreductase
MRAYQLPKGGAGIDALVKVERPDPKPAYRQVVVKVKACSLNFRDLGIVRGTYRMPVRENLIPLSDGAGEVIEVGPGVTRVKVGDRVAGWFFQRCAGGEAPSDVHASALGGGIDGMLAEYAVLEEDGIVKLPGHLLLEEGATPPLCWRHRLERDDGARKADGRSDGVVARNRWRLDLRPPARAHDGDSGDHYIVER